VCNKCIFIYFKNEFFIITLQEERIVEQSRRALPNIRRKYVNKFKGMYTLDGESKYLCSL
jgi:hypothetical protein